MSKKLGIFGWTALILAIAGGLNWVLVGIWGFDLVDKVFMWNWLSSTVKILAGLAGIGVPVYLRS